MKGVHGVFYFNGNYIDPTCASLSEKQRQAIMKVNKNNSDGLVIKMTLLRRGNYWSILPLR